LIRRPNRPDTSSSFAIGLELVTLNPQLAMRYQLPETMQGALIVHIEPESPLATACQINDVISRINDRPIQSAQDAARLVNERGDHDRLILSIDRRARGGIERHTYRVP
jgi:serine protease Do